MFSFSRAQFTENFDDGNHITHPTWKGDTSAFVVNSDGMLQLVAPVETSERYLATPSEAIENAVWEFEIQMDFNPSSSNYADVFLVSDSEDPGKASGYFVRIGNTLDEISLYRQDGDLSDITKILDGTDKILDMNPVFAKIKVTRNETGTWDLYRDMGTEEHYQHEGEVFDNTYMGSSFFGIYCHYTASRANKFYFDNITVTGRSKSDVFPPKISSLSVIDENNLKLIFTEKIVLDHQNPEIHFLENCRISQPARVDFEFDSVVVLNFTASIPENSDCQLLLNSIADRAQNTMKDTSVIFRYVPPKQPGFNELLITEIMADPTPNVELPEYEYLEIYNPLDEKLRVKGLELKIRGVSNLLSDFDIEAHEYLILCPTSAVDDMKEFGKVLGVANWKSLLNGGDTILLYNRNGKQVFSIAYQLDWYGNFQKVEGGYSLEMVDTKNPCGEKSNWAASEEVTGGTPGLPNSVKMSNPDVTAPEIVTVLPETKNEIVITLNEKLLKSSLFRTSVDLDPRISLSKVEIEEPFGKSLRVKLDDSLKIRQTYHLSLQGIKDCAGNTQSGSSREFVLPEKADSLDIVFNEVLFNPVPGGVDFIELINRSEKYIDLIGWKFLRENDGRIVEKRVTASQHLILKPGQMVVFTEDAEVLTGQFPYSAESLMIESDIPPMNDTEGVLALADESGSIVDKLYYHEDFHHPMIQNEEGVSLERISYSTGSSDPEVWQSAASTVGFATPGRKNSQYLNFEMESVFFIEPKAFAPDNDGYKDFTSINFRLTQNYLASLFIYDRSGRVVRQLLNNENLPTEGTIIWEGDDDQGNKVNIGNYLVYLELIGQKGERKVFRDTVAVAARF